MASQIPITIKAPPLALSSAAVRGKKRPGTVNLTVVAAPYGSCAGSKKKRQTITTSTQQQVPSSSSLFTLLTAHIASFRYYYFCDQCTPTFLMYRAWEIAVEIKKKINQPYSLVFTAWNPNDNPSVVFTVLTRLYCFCRVNAALASESIHLCSLLSECFHRNKVLQHMCLLSAEHVIFNVSADDSGGVGGWGNSWQWSNHARRVHSETSTVQGPSLYGDWLCVEVCFCLLIYSKRGVNFFLLQSR